MENKRLSDLKRFYSIINALEKKNIQKKLLLNSNGRQKWHKRGVYFFFESNQKRSDSGNGLRVTRVGTHAIQDDSKRTLWNRLSDHKGTAKTGGGDHRSSIFRLLVGTAIMQDKNLNFLTWGEGSSALRYVKDNELELEQLVSQTIGKMPFLYLSIDDEASPNSLRAYIEQNSIALLSNYNKSTLDGASEDWLGHKCNREKVNHSGLWNQKHVNESYDPCFLDIFEKLVIEMRVNA
ncbi:MAG: hypothetical protein U9N59_07785 [Campylobacterota bacterium]|nr:hypothetical protein [Campylobacterota bacterium]